MEVEVRLGPDALGRRLRWFGNQPHRRLSSRHTCSPGAPCIENGRNMITVVEGEQDKPVGELRRWQAKVRRRPYWDNIDWQISAHTAQRPLTLSGPSSHASSDGKFMLDRTSPHHLDPLSSYPAQMAALLDPLSNFVPRKVSGHQVLVALVRWGQVSLFDYTVLTLFQESHANPFTKSLHGSSYKSLLDSRKRLPIFTQINEFYNIVSNCTVMPSPSQSIRSYFSQFNQHQVIVIVGETGSGKTTQ